MFSRNFMKAFPVRKYARLSGACKLFCNQAGSISTDAALLGARDLIPYRTAIYILSTAVSIMAYYNFEFFYETIRHVPGPHFHAVIFLSQSDLVR